MSTNENETNKPKPVLTEQQLNANYTYEEPPDETPPQELEPNNEATADLEPVIPARSLPNITQYTDAVKELAQQKLFHVQFLDDTKKIYQRRKASMKEVIELERKRAIMKQSKGAPLTVAQALADFYWTSAQCHLVETKTGKPMSKKDYENVIFEDFRKIIDACEFVMLFGVPS